MKNKCKEDHSLISVKIIDRLFNSFNIYPSRVGSSGRIDITLTYLDIPNLKTMVLNIFEDFSVFGYITKNFEVVFEQNIGKKMSFRRIVKVFKEM